MDTILEKAPHPVAGFIRNATHGNDIDSGGLRAQTVEPTLFGSGQNEKLCSGRVETGRTELSLYLG